MKSQKKGRPATHFSDSLRVSYWSNQLFISSGLDDIQGFEALLRDRHDISLASGLFGRYIRGDAIPQGALSGSDDTLVHQLEAIFPGSSHAFFSQVWEMLVWSPDVDLTEMRSRYLALGDYVHIHFVRNVSSQYGRDPVPANGFWYLPKSSANLGPCIGAAPAKVRLQLALLEAKMAYAGQRYESFVIAQSSACDILASQQLENTAPVARRLKGVLLAMEALCLDALLITTVDPSCESQARRDSIFQSRRKYSDWVRRCTAYAKELPKVSKAQFKLMISSETDVGRMRGNF